MPRPRKDRRHRAREAALQILYQSDIGRIDVDDAAETFFGLFKVFGAESFLGSVNQAGALGSKQWIPHINRDDQVRKLPFRRRRTDPL